MTDNGGKPASWSATNGTHTLVVTEAFTHLPEVKPELVGAQIHDATHDITVFRLEGPTLYITDDNNPHYKLVTSNYVLGTRFQAKYVVAGGQIRVYYNDILQTTIRAPSLSGAYFTAGAYTQANCGNSAPCNNTNYGETAIYTLSVTHQVNRDDYISDRITHGLPIGIAAIMLIMLAYLLARRVRSRNR
jgi:hypothetical protein